MRRATLALLAALLLQGCIASNVLDPGQRDVETVEVLRKWRPAKAEDMPGFYASEEVTGDAAGALLKAYYYFGHDGAYSGAALVVGEEGPRFLTLQEEGHWSLDEAGLDLADGSGKLQAEVADEHLRLVSPDSTITFLRVELQ